MTRAELLAEIDAATEIRLATWRPVQDAYFFEHGRYMQVLCSHSVYPADGAATEPDRLAEAPHYQQEAIADLGFGVEPLTAAFAVDTHDGPEGHGWTLWLFVTWQGETWERAIGHGAHAMTIDWREVVDGTD